MDDKPSKLSSAVRIAKKTRVIVRENIIFALAVKALVLILGAIGIATMWKRSLQMSASQSSQS